MVPEAPAPSISDIEGTGRLGWYTSWNPLRGPGGSGHLGWHRALGLSETSRIRLQSRTSQGLIEQAEKGAQSGTERPWGRFCSKLADNKCT